MKRNLLFVISSIVVCSIALAQNGSQKMAGGGFFSDSTDRVIKVSAMKNNVVKLYPNPSYGKISVSANSKGKLNFYIFDLEGTLVYQTVLNKNERKTIENLAKGMYTYDVFEKDESIEEGKIIIK